MSCGFQSFFLGGFECSTHRRRDGVRLDLIAATQHDRFALQDYARLKERSILTARDGIRWHLIETKPYRYDFSSAIPMLRAAEAAGIQVIWDVCHYGWPDDLDLFSAEFPTRFCSFARAFAEVVAEETSGTPYFSPMNEISFFSWAAGAEGCFYPCVRGRGNELKAQLVKANISAVRAIRGVLPNARFVQIDPVVHIVIPSDLAADEARSAVAHRNAVFDAWDMVAGRKAPELGGSEDLLDIVGVNYYVHNQWIWGGKFIERDHPSYRPFHEILAEVYARFQRPLFIAETGIEADRRPEWLRYICDEVAIALESGVPIEGICLYPIVNHPGWDDNRHCHNGLWDYCNESGQREIYSSLACELDRQNARLGGLLRDLTQNTFCAGVSV